MMSIKSLYFKIASLKISSSAESGGALIRQVGLSQDSEVHGCWVGAQLWMADSFWLSWQLCLILYLNLAWEAQASVGLAFPLMEELK